MILELQKGIIYGPVNSRRLGRSLGINILPPARKVCPFNCVYCQYGWTETHVARADDIPDLPSVNAVRSALKNALTELPTLPAYITFSGNGEPTLHPEFDKIVEEVITLRGQLAPGAKTAILSNSALVSDPLTRASLSKLDMRIMKLDCGSRKTFTKYNQPCPGVDIEAITEGLVQLSAVHIQTLVAAGGRGNLNPENIEEWIERLKRIKPVSIQLYTLDRGYPSNQLRPAGREDLNRIQGQVQKERIVIDVF
ncbi:MAG: radical SAM protein [Candidatus Aminicenantes bacterium]|nr:radical SAM protein [Candidatus Aminicenantes bacterium]